MLNNFHFDLELLEFLPDICWEKMAEEILFVFCFDGFTSNKPTHYPLDYVDYYLDYIFEKL